MLFSRISRPPNIFATSKDCTKPPGYYNPEKPRQKQSFSYDYKQFGVSAPRPEVFAPSPFDVPVRNTNDNTIQQRVSKIQQQIANLKISERLRAKRLPSPELIERRRRRTDAYLKKESPSPGQYYTNSLEEDTIKNILKTDQKSRVLNMRHIELQLLTKRLKENKDKSIDPFRARELEGM